MAECSKDLSKGGLGREGEDYASRFLIENGFKVIARNVRCHTGEIDIVAKRGDELHFIEVKTRTNIDFDEAFEAVTDLKRRRVRRTAEAFLMSSKDPMWKRNMPICCFDVIAVCLNGDDTKLECIFNAF